MKFSFRYIFDLIVIVFFALFVYEAREWRLQARLYPWVIGLPMLLVALIHLFNDVTGRTEKQAAASSANAPVDFQFSQAVDEKTARQRTINIFAWIFGFFAAVWLLGFSIGIPLFVFLYLKVQSSESWLISVTLTAVAWFVFWGLFDWLLKLPFPDGAIFRLIGS